MKKKRRRRWNRENAMQKNTHITECKRKLAFLYSQIGWKNKREKKYDEQNWKNVSHGIGCWQDHYVIAKSCLCMHRIFLALSWSNEMCDTGDAFVIQWPTIQKKYLIYILIKALANSKKKCCFSESGAISGLLKQVENKCWNNSLFGK